MKFQLGNVNNNALFRVGWLLGANRKMKFAENVEAKKNWSNIAREF